MKVSRIAIIAIILVCILIVFAGFNLIKQNNNINYSVWFNNDCESNIYDSEQWLYETINDEYEQCSFTLEDYTPNRPEKKLVQVRDILLENYEISKGNGNNYTVFIGDSITRYYNNYYEISDDVINLGVPGATSYDIYKYLNAIYFTTLPTEDVDNVVITLGTNDGVIANQYDDYTMRYTVDIINSIVERIYIDNPKVNIYVVAPFVTNSNVKLNIDLNSTDNIQKYDEYLEQNISEKAMYVNINDAIEDENGNLNSNYTDDGLHPNEKGYQVIIEALKEQIEW